MPDMAGTQSGHRFSTTSRLYDTLAEVCYISHNATDITIILHMTTKRSDLARILDQEPKTILITYE